MIALSYPNWAQFGSFNSGERVTGKVASIGIAALIATFCILFHFILRFL